MAEESNNVITSTKVKFKKDTSSGLLADEFQIEDGAIYITTDTGEMYLGLQEENAKTLLPVGGKASQNGSTINIEFIVGQDKNGSVEFNIDDDRIYHFISMALKTYDFQQAKYLLQHGINLPQSFIPQEKTGTIDWSIVSDAAPFNETGIPIIATYGVLTKDNNYEEE